MSTGADVLAAQALGADLAYLGTRFIATDEGNAPPEYKQMLIDSSAEDIVYTSLFSGVTGNYLRGSVARAGLDPDNLPEADKTKMNFGTGGNTGSKHGGISGAPDRASAASTRSTSVAALVDAHGGRIAAARGALRLLAPGARERSEPDS